MAASRNLPTYITNLQNNKWQCSGTLGLGRTLHGPKLGISGYGKIGQCTAQYAKAFEIVVDMFDVEPASVEVEPLLSLPNVIATPHLGYVEQNSYELYFRIAFEDILAFDLK